MPFWKLGVFSGHDILLIFYSDNAITASEAPAGHVPVPSSTEGRLAINDSACFPNVSGSSSLPEISAAQDPLTGSETIITTDHGGCPADNAELETEVTASVNLFLYVFLLLVPFILL